MKKSTVLFAVLALVAAGCTKTRIVDIGAEGGQRSIGFSAYTTRPTKAAQADVTTANLSSFQVTAIGNGAVYFSDAKFEKNAQSEVWKSTPAYFWPAFALDFYAYNKPEKGTFTPNIGTESQTIFVKPSETLSEQEDLVAATLTAQNEPQTGATSITFRHYLTQVIVKALNNNDNYSVVVDGVKLTNLSGEGTYTFNNNTMKATDGLANSDNSVDYDETFTATTLNSTAQEVMTSGENGKWYLITQNVTAWQREAETPDMTNASNGTYLALKVKISAKSSSKQIYPISGEESAWMAVPVPASLKFEQGKKYTVIVKFFGDDGNGGAGYVDPETPGDLDGDSDANNDKGKKIIGGVIKFNASVDPWDETNNTITISL